MAILMSQEVPGMTAGQAEALIAQILDQLKTFPGFIAHATGPTPEGYQVTEVWESQEAHERWVREVVMPILQQAGLSELPPHHYLPLDRFFTR